MQIDTSLADALLFPFEQEPSSIMKVVDSVLIIPRNVVVVI